MPSVTLSPDMNLPIPVVGVDTGPDWANNINACFTIIDGHDHSSGNGVPITPAGLSIITDLSILNNNISQARSVRFQAQLSPLAESTDLGCIYESGVDLYYNDGNGNQIRITESGGVAGTPGSISNLTSPASASYVAASSTFVWQSDTNKAANMDAGSLIVRKLTTSSPGITIQAPSSLASNYALVLPALPASQKFMTLDASGNMAAPWAVDNSTIEVASSTTVQVKDSGITTAKINDLAVTTAKINTGAVTQAKVANRAVANPAAAGEIALSSSTGTFTTNSSTYVTVETVTITTVGNPVQLGLVPTGSSSDSALVGADASSGTSLTATLTWFRDGVAIARSVLVDTVGSSSAHGVSVPPNVMGFLDTGVIGAAGTYVYTLQAKRDTANTNIYVQYCKVMAYEIK